MALATLRRDGRGRHPRPARRRLRALQRRRRPGRCPTSRRCSTTTRCWRAPTCTAGRPAGERRAAGGLPRHAGLGAARDARPRGRLLLGARCRLRGRRGPLLRLAPAPSCASCWATDADGGDRLAGRQPSRATSPTRTIREPGLNVLTRARARRPRASTRERIRARCWSARAARVRPGSTTSA